MSNPRTLSEARAAVMRAAESWASGDDAVAFENALDDYTDFVRAVERDAVYEEESENDWGRTW